MYHGGNVLSSGEFTDYCIMVIDGLVLLDWIRFMIEENRCR
jgi:hypothetical protein